MPTVLRAAGFRVYFYSRETGEPPHVHIDRGGATAKLWLAPVRLASSAGFAAHELSDVLDLVRRHERVFWRHGVSSSMQTVTADPRVRTVATTDHELSVGLMDGRTISVPLAWYPRLAQATPAQRARWEIAGAGYGIHWPEVDEDLSTDGLLLGLPAPAGSHDWRSKLIEKA